ncbi:hypothetical protein [Micromonospora sp. NPDC005220]|uniref:hypothetical protein n=1 Tax=Micromonospora sp. NPDC005220 TaxID=3155589 RepID=UPI0033AEC04D
MTQPLPDPVRAAIAEALTSGVQTGLRINGFVFLVTAVLALTLIRNRPHQHQEARRAGQPATLPASTR